VATAGHGSALGHIPPHLTPAALVRRFPPITDMVPTEQRNLLGSGDAVLYFSFIGKKGGCTGVAKRRNSGS
jgi:hypothetical protein